MRILKQSLTVTYQICWSKKVIHPHSEYETVPPLHHHRCYSLTIFCILFQLFVFPLSQLSYKHDKLSFLSVLLDVSASHNVGIISGPNWLSMSNKNQKTCEKSFKTTEKNRAYCWCQVFADFGIRSWIALTASNPIPISVCFWNVKNSVRFGHDTKFVLCKLLM